MVEKQAELTKEVNNRNLRTFIFACQKTVDMFKDTNFEIDLEDKFEEVESKVLKRKKVDMNPMVEEEAIMQMEMLGHSFFVFKNAETNNICVLYLRKDGNYGIIETN